MRKAPLPSPAPCLLPSPSSPSSFLLSSCIWVSEERIASHALPFPLICKQAPSNYVSPEALSTRVFKFYSLSGGSQTPDLGVLPRCRTMIAELDIYQSQQMCRCIRVACSADQATEMWVYPTFTCRGLLEFTFARFSRSLLPPPPVCFSVRKALGPSRMVTLGFLVRESLCSMRGGGFFSRLVFLFRLWPPPLCVSSMRCPSAQGSSCSACCLRIRPGPKSSPHIRPAVSNFTDRSEGLPCPPCLLYSQLHGCEDLKWHAFPGPLFSSATCRTSVFRHWTSWFLPSSPTRV